MPISADPNYHIGAAGMPHPSYVRIRKNGIVTDVHRAKAFQLIESKLMPRPSRYAHLFWSWIWMLSIPGALVLGIAWKWWAGLLLFFFSAKFLRSAIVETSCEAVLEHAGNDAEFRKIAIDNGVLNWPEMEPENVGGALAL